MKFGSLFSGIEAASVAWHPLGWECAWVSEIEPFPCAVLAHHYPEVPNLGDVTSHIFAARAAAQGPVDLIVGGSPCQAFSVAGLRQSLDDDRGNLTLRFVEIVHELKPAWIVWENVPGVLNTKDNAFGCFLAGITGADSPLMPPGGRWPNFGLVSGAGYNLAWAVKDAQFFGVPQRRRRVFVVASLGSWACAEALFPVSQGLRGDSAAGGKKRAGVTQAITARLGGGGPDDNRAQGGHIVPCGTVGNREVAYALKASIDKQDETHETYVAHSLRAEGFDASEDGTGRGTPIIPINSQIATRHNAMGRGTGLGVGEDGDKMFTTGANQHHAIAFQERGREGGRNLEMSDELAYSLNNPGKGGRRNENCVAFDTTQITSKGNYSNPRPGDPCHPIAAGAHPPAVAGYLSSRACRNSDSANEVGIKDGRISDTLQSDGPGAVAFEPRCARNERGMPSEVVPPLKAQSGQTGKGDAAPCVAWAFNGDQSAKTRSMGEAKEQAPSLRAGGPVHLATTMQVRRLTPTECSRLQGFPDDYLPSVAFRGKCPPADGSMYRALGNSMAVPVMRWIGERIMEASHEANRPD